MKKSYSILFGLSLLMGNAHAQGVFQQTQYSPKSTTFKTIADPDADKVVLRIYQDDGITQKSPISSGNFGFQPLSSVRTVRMKHDKTKPEQWTAKVKGDFKGRFYTFEVYKDGKGYGETTGVFATAVGCNGKRAAIIDMSATNPDGFINEQRPASLEPQDWMIYEMHHRDFSTHPSTGILHKGKFLALTEPHAIAYLKQLGINAVHILPSFDYASVDESKLDVAQYNWGYDPLNYNVPEGSYATDATDPSTRIREFKMMVQALHKAGIRVILDVVYNHTFDIDGSPLQRTWPDYYYRKNADGTYSNGSGCGNETASEKPYMRQFMIESTRYWVNEYHIDGFRFDLMGVHDIETMREIRKNLDGIGKNILIYGEGWAAGSCAYDSQKLAMKANVYQMDGIAAFSDEIRDGLRGPWNDDKQGAFLIGKSGNKESVKFGIAGGVSHPQVDMTKVNYAKENWANQPTQFISYVSCHDDMCLVDRLRTNGCPDDEIARLSVLAQTAVFTSQGIPFMLSGEELLRDKKGVHNSYNSPDSVNQLNWDNIKKYPHVFDFYSHLTRLRSNHKGFRLGNADAVRAHLEFIPTSDDCTIAFRLKNLQGIDSWNNIIVILNANREARTIQLPNGNYTIVARGFKIDENGLGNATNEITVNAQEISILHD